MGRYGELLLEPHQQRGTLMSEQGQWVARHKDGHRITKWHYIESEIADREITRCGRQMKARAGTIIQASVDLPPEDACEICSG